MIPKAEAVFATAIAQQQAAFEQLEADVRDLQQAIEEFGDGWR